MLERHGRKSCLVSFRRSALLTPCGHVAESLHLFNPDSWWGHWAKAVERQRENRSSFSDMASASFTPDFHWLLYRKSASSYIMNVLVFSFVCMFCINSYYAWLNANAIECTCVFQWKNDNAIQVVLPYVIAPCTTQ